MMTTRINEPRGEFKLYFIITTEVFARSVRVKHVVCSRTIVVLNLIELHSLKVWRSFHSLAANKICELDINNVCLLNIEVWFSISLYFSIGKITTAVLMHSFRVWYVQCLAKRLTLNFIEFIQSNVWRSYFAVKNFYEELDDNDIGRAFPKSNGFRFKTV